MAAWFRMIICFGMAIMIISLIVSGQLPLLLHPRFHIWTYFSVVIFIIFGWIQAIHLKSKDVHPIRIWGYLFVMLPLVAYIFIPPKALDASIINKKGSIVTQANPQKQKKEKDISTYSSSENNPDDPNYKDFQVMKKARGTIEFTDKKFANYVSTLDLYGEKLKGKRFKLKGFVYREPGNLKKNQLIVGRFIVSCCTADANVLGLIAQFDDAQQLKSDQWYEITGTLTTTKVFDYPSPLIMIESYKTATKPKDPYVYFSY